MALALLPVMLLLGAAPPNAEEIRGQALQQGLFLSKTGQVAVRLLFSTVKKHLSTLDPSLTQAERS